MTEKMTDEELEKAFQVMRGNGLVPVATLLRAHIAALTAERDEAEVRHAEEIEAWKDATGLECGWDPDGVTPNGLARFIAGLEQERDALRERVKALEAESARLREHVKATIGGPFGPEVILLRGGRNLPEWEAHARVMESRLAAIRQRVEDSVELARIYDANQSHIDGFRDVSRYILGDDAPAPSETSTERVARICAMPDARIVGGMDAYPSEMDGLRGEMTESPAPTTSEAFAFLREDAAYLEKEHPNTVERMARMPSLLERRIGAQDAALRAVVDFERGVRTWTTIKEECRTALTDAPHVFTLEEAKQLVANAVDATRDAILSALRR